MTPKISLDLFVIAIFIGIAVLTIVFISLVSLIFGNPLCPSRLGHGIVSRCAKGIASEYAPYSQRSSHKKASFSICLYSIGRACRRKATRWRAF